MAAARSASDLSSIEIVPLGDGALIVRVRETFEDAPEQTLHAVLTVQQRLVDARIAGVLEIAPAYTSVAIFYDPLAVLAAGAPIDGIFGWLEQRVGESLR